MRKSLLFLILFFAALLAIVNQTALKFNLYWSTSWVDTVAHILGGAVVSGLIVYFLSKKTDGYSSFNNVWVILLGSFLIGVLWEILEVKTGMTSPKDLGYALNTASDLFFDIFGSYIMYVFTTSIYGKR